MSETTPTKSSGTCECGAAFRMFTLGLLIFLLGIIATLVLKKWMGGTDAFELDRAAKRVEARLAIEAEAKKLLQANDWVDEGKRVVRVPIEQAVAMEIASIKQKQPRPAYAVGAPVPVPASAAPSKPATPAPAPAAANAAKPPTPPTATNAAPATPAAAPAPAATASAPTTPSTPPTSPK